MKLYSFSIFSYNESLNISENVVYCERNLHIAIAVCVKVDPVKSLRQSGPAIASSSISDQWGQAEKALENTARKYLHTLYFTWKWCTYQINDKCWISVKHKITHYSVTLSFAHVDKVNIGGCEVKKKTW